METKWWAIAFMLVCTIFTSFGMIFMKWGSEIFSSFALSTLVFLVLGFGFYGIGAGFNILALRGGQVSVLFPIFALNYIWVNFLSIIFLGEQMNMLKWLGALGIVVGISLVGFGSNNKNKKIKVRKK
ncbi:hypothetical protein KY311_04305 [Candidatus Woesearchaeota archaeon]|nr:hypothetical protein [Candidatus Woesearchaeota archaeon]MBW3017239.1 hypothetical protein [Candidatus Woesearchaeota archaeon]